MTDASPGLLTIFMSSIPFEAASRFMSDAQAVQLRSVCVHFGTEFIQSLEVGRVSRELG